MFSIVYFGLFRYIIPINSAFIGLGFVHRCLMKWG